jgi:hypothetical protein
MLPAIVSKGRARLFEIAFVGDIVSSHHRERLHVCCHFVTNSTVMG